MLLYESDLYKQAKSALESSFGLRQIFDYLPPSAEFSVLLDERITCTLKMLDGKIALLPMSTARADIQIIFMTEALRRLDTDPNMELLPLCRVLIECLIQGQVKIKRLTSYDELNSKGYFDRLKNLPPEIQKFLLAEGLGALDKLSTGYKKILQLLRVIR